MNLGIWATSRSWKSKEIDSPTQPRRRNYSFAYILSLAQQNPYKISDIQKSANDYLLF